METKTIKKSVREINREKTINKLVSAMKTILEKYDYDTVTIKNICTVSGVAYGSFYNLFESKEKFLTYYLTNDFQSFMKEYYKDRADFQNLTSLEKVIDIFKCCGIYNQEKGLKFICGFYSPHNNSLSPFSPRHREGEHYYSFTPLKELSKEYLLEAQRDGIIAKDASIEEIVNWLIFLFNGITFNWCISNGTVDANAYIEVLFKDCLKKYTS